MSQTPKKRSRLYIDPEVQSALMRSLCTHWLVFMIVCFLVTGVVQAFIENPSISISEMITYGLRRNILPIITGIAMLPLFIYDTLKLTNRFVGPIWRLRTTLRTIADGGPVPQLKTRSTDFWHEISDEFNRAVRKLQSEEIEHSDRGQRESTPCQP